MWGNTWKSRCQSRWPLRQRCFVATYNSGSRIQVETEFGATHGGQFHLELCAQQTETDNCFVPLTIISGNVMVRNNTACVDNSQSQINVQVQLPTGVRCNRWEDIVFYRSLYTTTTSRRANKLLHFCTVVIVSLWKWNCYNCKISNSIDVRWDGHTELITLVTPGIQVWCYLLILHQTPIHYLFLSMECH